jgi:hypothetical protein
LLAAAVFAAGACTAVLVSERYAEAAALRCACGLTWGRAEHPQLIDAAAARAMQVSPRPGHMQVFYVEILNPAPVTQTILGLTSDGRGPVAEPTHLDVAVAGTSPLDDESSPETRHYTAKPTDIPPGGVRWLRYTIHTAPARYWSKGDVKWWDSLQLRVRVGWFDRVETVGFDGASFVLRA